jgi:hypothetical protein
VAWSTQHSPLIEINFDVFSKGEVVIALVTESWLLVIGLSGVLEGLPAHDDPLFRQRGGTTFFSCPILRISQA